MTDVQRRETVVRRVEHVVPASQPWGATRRDVELAIHLAQKELGEDRAHNDDSVRLFPGDDEIVIRYETEESAP
ncbi:hypothetical protein [Prauserella endophytica]|uniref:Uncharacterized protein n=1 Tax=Prauserella endophytica TaxID=1592324 RepID=A0ABY2S1I8_9PSEU|nr:hypothetical protein [Prauserella endophytica]PXY20336.1 hypothetical protein BAY59_31350 [Prauserella coralliicola]TKG66938.1 hypothetical protein FCN18_23795 [Prauserella endophytica]